jgi:drug/metabolite transporter (DMT)-like permease
MLYLGELAALATAGFWSTSSFLFTTASIRIGSIQLNIDRMLLAGVFIAITILVGNITFGLTTNQFLYLTLSGFLGLTLGDTFLFAAFKEVGPRISMLIMSFNPAIATIAAWLFLGEDLAVVSVLGIGITLSGIALVILEKPKVDRSKFPITKMGIIFAFLAATGQASGLIFAKQAYNVGEIHFMTATFYRIITSIITLLPIGIYMKRYLNPIKLYKNDNKALKMVALGSIIGPYLGITLSFLAVTNTKVGIASTLMATMPIIMLPLTYFFYKEKLTTKSIVGAFIAVAGVSLLFLN